MVSSEHNLNKLAQARLHWRRDNLIFLQHVASGPDGSFADPETSSVTSYSSRGPCIVDSGNGLQTRNHPVTTAATGVQTSTAGKGAAMEA